MVIVSIPFYCVSVSIVCDYSVLLWFVDAYVVVVIYIYVCALYHPTPHTFCWHYSCPLPLMLKKEYRKERMSATKMIQMSIKRGNQRKCPSSPPPALYKKGFNDKIS